MANLILVSQAERESKYTGHHIRYLVREGIISGRKEGGIWLVDLDELKAYEAKMNKLGTSKHDPTRGQEKS